MAISSEITKSLKEVMNKWVICNSSHVIDLVFFLIGTPNDSFTSYFHSGESDWHNPTKFHGAGISIKNIPFSYQADWGAPGRWGIEILTESNRYILRPMEELSFIKLGEFDSKNITLEKGKESNFKSGLLDQSKAFFAVNKGNLCSLEQHYDHYKYYLKIAGY